MSRINALGGCLMFSSSIAARERELVILRTAASTGCDYEIHHHRLLGAESGLDQAEIAAALDPTIAHEWSSADRAILRVAEEVEARADVGDEAWEGLDGVLDDGQRLELLVLVGFYRLIAGVVNGTRVEIDQLVGATE